MLIKSIVTYGLVALVTSCGAQKSNESQVADSAHFEPVPSDLTSVEAMLSRYEGQTSFLNVEQDYSRNKRSFGGGGGAAESGLESAVGGEKRDIQEADIFKVGPKGSKLLYLLNNSRGLQVVSFAKGADKPELLGRVEPTGNSARVMYADHANSQIIVLEDTSSYQRNRGYDRKGQLVIYDVADAKAPKIVSSTEFKGGFADSRLVGDVLYVAAWTPENNQSWRKTEAQGYVYSFKLGAGEATLIQNYGLEMPAFGENMNIVEVGDAVAGYKYYLVAKLSKTRWGWWRSSKGVVEVVDISSPYGKIEPLMIVPTKGQILERSSTSIKNNSLTVVSQYRSEVGQQRQRVAVETFNFPKGDGTDLLAEDEVKFRQLNIKREVAKLKAGGASEEDVQKFEAKLLADKDLGLNGYFVKKAKGGIEKIVADFVVTIGDTTGQHARLQDVRFHNDLLYVFWVPANNIDPLDVFDFSAPEKGVSHLGHLEFEGWIQRSFPVSYKGKEFLVGLGQVVPSVNNEEGRRHPQARLFQIVKKRGGVKAIDIDNLTFKDSNIYTQLNGQDKFVEFRWQDAKQGKAVIMFRVDKYEDQKYVSGGKLIGVDFEEALSQGEVFTEGALLATKWGWLRRVFTNTEIEKVNTFSNEELAVYSPSGIGAASVVENAIASLELARNIRGFVTLDKNHSVQIIQKGQSWYWLKRDDSKLELRIVKKTNADAEVANVISTVKLDGTYAAHEWNGKELLIALTSDQYNTTEKKIEKTVALSKFKLVSGKLVATGSAVLKVTAAPSFGRGIGLERSWMPWYQPVKVKLASLHGKLFLSVGDEMKIVTLGATEIALGDVAIEACVSAPKEGAAISFTSDQIVKTWVNYLDKDGKPVDPANPLSRAEFGANHVAVISPKSANTFSCGVALNVPGKIVETWDNKLVTMDQRVIGNVAQPASEATANGGNGSPVVRRSYTQYVFRTVYASLELKAKAAVLRDLYDPRGDGEGSDGYYGASSLGRYQQDSNSFIFAEPKKYDGYSSVANLSELTVSDSNRFLKVTQPMDLGQPGTVDLVDVLSVNGKKLALITGNKGLTAVSWDQGIRSAQMVKLHRVLDGQVAKEGAYHSKLWDTYSLQDNYWNESQTKIDLDEAELLLNIPQGLSGMLQYKVAL